MATEEPYCAICRVQIDPAKRHVQIEAETKGEDVPESEYYRFHLDCWDSVASGWGRPG